MSGWEIRLSADETAMAMAQAGNGELALQLLFAQTQAPLSADEASSRLTAASEALAARGLADDRTRRLITSGGAAEPGRGGDRRRRAHPSLSEDDRRRG